MKNEVLRYVAFSADPAGGNPAGVVLDASGLDEAAMARIAADLGYSETAFVFPGQEAGPAQEAEAGEGACFEVRYFSPLIEVPFCGHATIATAVAHAQRHGAGELTFRTKAGEIRVSTEIGPDAAVMATLVSVAPRSEPVPPDVTAELLDALRWSADDLDPALPVRAAYAGAWHPVIAAADRARLARLDYDGPALSALMARHGWTTVNLVWRESPSVFHSRNPFPPGGVVEDPATGAAAAALGGYLRTEGLVDAPTKLTVYQGYDMGRPSTIRVRVPEGAATGIEVGGTGVAI
ncbi:PhzF family phenazine biosynthesis protein [Streptomyces sp. NPDC058195]|uniref:PhzF family phenazine biosynthesis protein n=1 Tax=Streptomyces sp. NPDC058195 TaxID=3346375 RepID=UPI0036E3DDC5